MICESAGRSCLKGEANCCKRVQQAAGDVDKSDRMMGHHSFNSKAVKLVEESVFAFDKSIPCQRP